MALKNPFHIVQEREKGEYRERKVRRGQTIVTEAWEADIDYAVDIKFNWMSGAHDLWLRMNSWEAMQIHWISQSEVEEC